MIDNDKYCPWHVHTIFSLLDGCNKIKDLVKKSKEYGFVGCSITDHGSMSGVVEHFQTCNKQGIKPLLGCEIYLNDNRKALIENKGVKKESKSESASDKDANHLVLIAKNIEGYKNLLKIQGNANKEGFYRFPLSTNEFVLEHSDGLMASTACLGSLFNRNIMKGKETESEALVQKYKESFGEDFFLEIQVNGHEEQVKCNSWMIDMSKKYDIPLILGNDCHYLESGDHFLQLMKICTKTQWTLAELQVEIAEGRFMSHFDTLYLLTPDNIKELRDLHHPEISDSVLQQSLENTYNGAMRTDVNIIDGEFKFPNFDQPTELENKEYFIKCCKDGFANRLNKGEIPQDKKMEYYDRLMYEIEVIGFRNFHNYFLVLQEALQFVTDTGGRNGAGRGSAAGSLVCYCLNITNLDPIKFNLYFERFLSFARGKEPTLKLEY
jgi:DNA polymerase-3 subunit alpha